MSSLGQTGVLRLDAHFAEFGRLVQIARRHLDSGRLDDAAGYCQIAGMYAWMNPVGLFGSDELEELLDRLSATLPALPAPRVPETPPRVVLHVATQVYQTGGSTQAIASWIEQDSERHHRVCLTRQGPVEIPPKIRSQLQREADLMCLDAKPHGLRGRAAALRAAATEADVVVLHLHPCDVVPSLAFAAARGAPPVVYVDHADHVFWLGRHVTQLLLSMRDSGRALALSRRGLEAERCFVMPRPLRIAERVVARDEAKRRLGLNPDRVLVVTAADGTKYRSVGEPAFLDLVQRVMRRHPELIFRAAGPAHAGEWAAAADATGGRLQALGRLPDISLLQQAADVYLDSYPFSSLTSLLEAGVFGTPVVTFRGHHEDCQVLGADTRGLDAHMQSPTTPEDFERTMGELVTDGQRRLALGDRTRRAIIATHTGAGWRAAVEELYARAAQMRSIPRVVSAERSTGSLDLLVDLVMEQTGFGQGVPGAVRANLGLLSPRERVAAWRGLVRADEPWRPSDVVPDCLRAPVARAGRRGRTVAALVTRRGPGPYQRA
jgi:hypothetical protein